VEVSVSGHFVVECGKITAGVAVPVPGGFRFFHSDPRFFSLEGRVFRRARTLIRKVAECIPRPARGRRRAASRLGKVGSGQR
jgi:hypothetical protein